MEPNMHPMTLALRRLRSEFSDGTLSVDELYASFERLTFQLPAGPLGRKEESQLRALVNDVELIRFGQLADNQAAAIDEVLSRALAVFEQVERLGAPGDQSGRPGREEPG